MLTRRPAKENVHPAIKVARVAAGREWNGIPRTNARWSQHGTQPLTQRGHASRWHHYPHRRRAAITWAVATALVLMIGGYAFSPASTATTLRVITLTALAMVTWMVVEKSRRWSHFQTYIAPTALALGDMLGMPRQADPRSWVHVPSDHRTNPDRQVTIDLPPAYHADKRAQKRLSEVAAQRLSMRNPDWDIDWDGDFPRLWLRACPAPPELVRFEQVRELAENCPAGEFIQGLGSRMTPVSVALSEDSPHILASIGSGGGKSNYGKWMALQAIARGSRVVIIDIVKSGASHKWAKGVPGVEIYRKPDTAHEALIKLSELVENRCESYWHHGNDGTDQQIMLIIEESNRTIRKLNQHWTENLEGTKTSPAVLAIEGVLCVGREAGVNAVTVGQRMSAAAAGGGDTRENYGVRLGNRFSRQTARMLFGDVTPLPPNVTHPGRVQMVIGTTGTEVQIPRLDDTDMAPLQWALARRDAVNSSVISKARGLGKQGSQDTGAGPVVSPGDGRRLRVVASNPGPEPEGPLVDENPDPDVDDGLVGLADAAVEIGVAVIALRNARARDREFPKPRGRSGAAKLYRVEELRQWAKNRERGGGEVGGDAS